MPFDAAILAVQLFEIVFDVPHVRNRDRMHALAGRFDREWRANRILEPLHGVDSRRADGEVSVAVCRAAVNRVPDCHAELQQRLDLLRRRRQMPYVRDAARDLDVARNQQFGPARRIDVHSQRDR